MSKTDTADLIARRSKLLARVVLTRRLNVDVHPFSDSPETGIDLLCTIRPEPDDKAQGFLPFAAIVWGTAKDLATEDGMGEFARAQRKAPALQTQFFMPAIVLLFSMHRDEAYFSWRVKPGKDSCKLLHSSELDFRPFDARQLDRMVNSIKKWYQRLATTLVVDAEEIGPSRGAEEQ